MKIEFTEPELRELIHLFEHDITYSRYESTRKLFDALSSSLESIAGYPNQVMQITTLNPPPVTAEIPLFTVSHSKKPFFMNGKTRPSGYYLTNGKHWLLRCHKTRKEAEAAKLKLNTKIQESRLL